MTGNRAQMQNGMRGRVVAQLLTVGTMVTATVYGFGSKTPEEHGYGSKKPEEP